MRSKKGFGHDLDIWIGLGLICIGIGMGSCAHGRDLMPTDQATGVQVNASSVSTSGAIAGGGAGGQGGSANATAAGGSGGQATASQMQTAEGGAGGTGGNASNLGNAQNLTFNASQVRQAPAVFAPAVYASGPCAYGWSAGASIPGGGASFGKTKPDTNCDRRELARVLTPLNPYLALKVLCADPLVRELYADSEEALDIECTYHPPVTPEPVVIEVGDVKATVDPQYATREDLDRAFRQAQSK